MIAEFMDSVAGIAVYLNPEYVVTLRLDPAEPTQITMVKLRDGETLRVRGEHREVAEKLAKSGKYFMGTINNESRELNLYRIQTFGLREIFSIFVSSCFVGLRKPEEAIYRMALDITQKSPENCCFIDDRALNLETAHQLGMHIIEMHDVEQLSRDLRKLGVEV